MPSVAEALRVLLEYGERGEIVVERPMRMRVVLQRLLWKVRVLLL